MPRCAQEVSSEHLSQSRTLGVALKYSPLASQPRKELLAISIPSWAQLLSSSSDRRSFKSLTEARNWSAVALEKRLSSCSNAENSILVPFLLKPTTKQPLILSEAVTRGKAYLKMADTVSSRLCCTSASSVNAQTTATWQARRGAIPFSISWAA